MRQNAKRILTEREPFTVLIVRYILMLFGVCVGIPYVLALIGIAKVADKHGQRNH